VETAIPLGRIAGVRVGMSWLVPLVATLWTLLLAERVLPLAVPGRTPTAYWLAAVGGAAGYFASILVHEVGHALVGRRDGMAVKGITLSLLGGHTEFESEPATPGAELRVSAVGPLANLALAVGFQLTTAFVGADAFGGVGLAGQVVRWLAVMNLLLAVANMIPAPPLDGAAVVGAMVWMAVRDRTRAALITSGIGIVVGVTVAGLGAWLLVRRVDPFTGVLVLGYGLFMVQAARRQRAVAPALGRLRAAPVASVMVPDPPIVPEWATVGDVVTWAAAHPGHRAFPVQAADGRITGVLTAPLVDAIDPGRWATLRAIDLAWPIDRVPLAGADESVLAVIRRAPEPAVPILVLGPDGRVAGVASPDAAERAGYVPPP